MTVGMDTQSDPEYCFGECVKCRGAVCGSGQACWAMGQLYHDSCFTCCMCSERLRGWSFYSMSGQIYCEEDFQRSRLSCCTELCDSCGFIITDTVVQAAGKYFHPACFHCVICKHSLQGEPFSVDAQNQLYCIEDFQRSVAPVCKGCGMLIIPSEGCMETVRVESMNQSYHLECFQCVFEQSAINNS